MVFTDHFTKWVEVFAIPRQTAEIIATHFVEQFICKHGSPESLLSDRGKAFLGELMTHIKKQMLTTPLFTSGYHPQTNGQTERFNKTLLDMLSMFTSENQDDWDVFIPFITFAYNTSVHDATNETPFYLVHGRDARSPELAVKEFDQSNSTDEYKHELISRLEKAWNDVR